MYQLYAIYIIYVLQSEKMIAFGVFTSSKKNW